MNDRKNLLSLLRRTGYERVPVDYSLTPDLLKRFCAHIIKNRVRVPLSPFAHIHVAKRTNPLPKDFVKTYYGSLTAGASIDSYGVAMEKGSAACMHLKKFRHPLQNATTLEEILAYPFPIFQEGVSAAKKCKTKLLKASGRFVMGSMQCTVWETAWYIRSMEALMMDMLVEPELANAVLDKVTENAIVLAKNYASAGVDGIFLGDDIGMQSTIMMSEELYLTYLKPRLKAVIDAARGINPNVLIFYHSCGYIKPFIPHLIEVGVDVLNPIQPECMDFEEIYNEFGDRLSFFGTLGTQTLLPFGTQEEVAQTVKKNLDLVGKKGGLLVAPTHVLEPEVPIENILAYMKACKNYTKRGKKREE